MNIIKSKIYHLFGLETQKDKKIKDKVAKVVKEAGSKHIKINRTQENYTR
jgi:hypothetical protein